MGQVDPFELRCLSTVRGPDNARILCLAGEIDGSSAPALDEMISALPGPLMLDLSEVGFCGSLGIRVLLKHYAEKLHAGAAFGVVAASPPVARLLNIIGIADMLGLPPVRSVRLVAS